MANVSSQLLSRNHQRRIQQELIELSDQLSAGREVRTARARLEAIDEELRSAGQESAHVAWQLGVAYDLNHLHGTALEHLGRAMRLDPACPQYRRSNDLVVRRIRDKLDGLRGDPGHCMVPALCMELLVAGEGDRDVALAMARHGLATGDLDSALEWTTGLSTLCPLDREFHELSVELARRMGSPAVEEHGQALLLGEAPGLEAVLRLWTKKDPKTRN